MSNDDVFARTIESSRRTRINRRQLLKAGAWATPAVVLATAAPARAASPAPTRTITVTQISATVTGSKGSESTYTGSVTLSNDSTSPIAVSLNFTSSGVAVLPALVSPGPVAVPAMGTKTVQFTMGTANNGAGKSVTATPASQDNTVAVVGRTATFQGGQSFSG